jgi:hypothetical protein
MFPDISTITEAFDEVMEAYDGSDDETELEIFTFVANLAWNGQP